MERIKALLAHAQTRITTTMTTTSAATAAANTTHDRNSNSSNSRRRHRPRRGRRTFEWKPGVAPQDVTLQMLLESAKAMDAAEIARELQEEEEE